jgi:hypothetical protein
MFVMSEFIVKKINLKTNVGWFFLLKKTFGHIYNNSCFLLGPLSVGLNMVLHISKPYGFGFGTNVQTQKPLSLV